MRGHRFTIYDALEKSGYFDSNPANTFAREPTSGGPLYAGPIEFPKMLYHPEGEERVIVPAEIILTPMGPKPVGEQREMLHQIVVNAVEEAELVAEGWHDHPAKALKARVLLFIEASPDMTDREKAKLMKSIPSISSENRVRELERELARLTGGNHPMLPEQPEVQAKPVEQVASPDPSGPNSLSARFNSPPIPTPPTPAQ